MHSVQMVRLSVSAVPTCIKNFVTISYFFAQCTCGKAFADEDFISINLSWGRESRKLFSAPEHATDKITSYRYYNLTQLQNMLHA